MAASCPFLRFWVARNGAASLSRHGEDQTDEPSASRIRAAAALGKSQEFKGDTSQNHKVTFEVSGHKVRDFSAGINMYCTESGIEVNAVIPPGSMKLNGQRKFAYKGRDTTDGTNIEIHGRLSKSGKKASGKIKMTDSRYNPVDESFDSCVGSATWKAKA